MIYGHQMAKKHHPVAIANCEHRFPRCYYLRLSQAVRIKQRREWRRVHQMQYILFGNAGGYYIVVAEVASKRTIVRPFIFIFACVE